MSLLRNAGLSSFRPDRTPANQQQLSQAQAKRLRQLEYMRELDKQIEEKVEISRSKSKSNSRGKKELASSMVSNHSVGRSHFAEEHQKYSKSAVLEQMLKVDYQTFKRSRPIKSRSRSKPKYHMLQEIGNEAEYRAIPQYKTIFVDAQGKQIQVSKRTHTKVVVVKQKKSQASEMRDDKNYSRGSVQKSQNEENKEQEYSHDFEQESQYTEQQEEKVQIVQNKEPSPPRAEPQDKPADIPNLQLQEIWKVSSLFLAHKLSKGSISDRLSSTINENKHRFPELFSILQKKSLQNQLSQLGQLITIAVKDPMKQHPRALSVTNSPVPRSDELVEIKDIINEIQKIAKPSYQRTNRFVDKDVELNQKIHKRLGLDKNFNGSNHGKKHVSKREQLRQRKGLDDLLESYAINNPQPK